MDKMEWLEMGMRSCLQFRDHDTLQHGISCLDWYTDLNDHLSSGLPLQKDWRLPDWIYDPIIPGMMYPIEQIHRAIKYHDSGKFMCRTVDDQGRQHFPDHARISSELWKLMGGTELECRLMAMDMDIHMLKGDGIQEFSTRPEAIQLMLIGLSEIHSNAQMFGGIQSDSFKMKWKQIDRRGKQILAKIKESR